MSRTSRILRAVILASAVGSLFAASALAAPGPKPPKNGPSFSATLNRDAYSAAGQQYVAMTFTSTDTKASKGQLQVTAPRQHPTQLYWVFLSWLQTTEPTSIPGYVRVEPTSCTSATLLGVTTGAIGTGNVVTANPTIDVAFACKPGQQFVIHWFTNLGFAGFNPGVEHPERWPVQIATRKGPDRNGIAGGARSGS